MSNPNPEKILIGVVGPCASGKSTLIRSLGQLGYQSRHIAQEHSYVADMWERITAPDILIYLDVSYPETLKRRNQKWTESDYKTEKERLQHARTNADLYIHTDHLGPQEVLQKVVEFIQRFEAPPGG